MARYFLFWAMLFCIWVVGRMAFADEQAELAHKCDMVEQGVWPEEVLKGDSCAED